MNITDYLSFMLFTLLNKRSDIKCLYLKKTLVNYSNKNNLCHILCIVGDAHMLMYAHKNGCKFDYNITLVAAVRGHRDCLKYIYENDKYKWHPKTTYVAAKHGHLSCLKYAYENKCRWDKLTVFAAIENKQIECVRYIHEVHLKMMEDKEKDKDKDEDNMIYGFQYECRYSNDRYDSREARGSCSYDYMNDEGNHLTTRYSQCITRGTNNTISYNDF